MGQPLLYPVDRQHSREMIRMGKLRAGWRAWMSPNGVQHLVPPCGACATCGISRHEVCVYCGGDIQPSHPTGSGFLWAHANGGITLCVADGAFTGTRAELIRQEEGQQR